jgi:hypothetical protein
MKLTLTTVYDNIDESWLYTYLLRLQHGPTAEVRALPERLLQDGVVTLQDDMGRGMTATTVYALIKDAQ